MKSEQSTRKDHLVDELGELNKVLDQAKARAKAELAKVDAQDRRAKEIREELLALHKDAPPEAELTVEGKQFTAIISPQENKREIVASTEKFYKLLGRAKFLDLWRPTLAALERVLSQEKFGECVKSERSGPRTITLVEKAKGA